MLKKRILILSGKIYRGVLKLTNLEANYLEIDFTAHFLSPGDYMLVIRIGEYSEKLRFNGEKLYIKTPFDMSFEGALEAAVIEKAPFEILMSASTEKHLSVSFNRLLEEYTNPVILKQSKEYIAPKEAVEKTALSADNTVAKPRANDVNLEQADVRQEKDRADSLTQTDESCANDTSLKQADNNLSKQQNIALQKQKSDASLKQTADTRLEKEAAASSNQKSHAAAEKGANSGTDAQSKILETQKSNSINPSTEGIAAEKSFFDEIKESITEFFENYPPYQELADIVPSSKWVKVDTEDTFYVVGLLFNTSGITHICYGIPGEYSVKPPSEILTEWLPLNPEEWDKAGFWMIYQNAETGQI